MLLISFKVKPELNEHEQQNQFWCWHPVEVKVHPVVMMVFLVVKRLQREEKRGTPRLRADRVVVCQKKKSQWNAKHCEIYKSAKPTSEASSISDKKELAFRVRVE